VLKMLLKTWAWLCVAMVGLLVYCALQIVFWSYLNPTWSCTFCVCQYSIHIKTPDNDCTPHVALLASEVVCGSGFRHVKSFLLTSHRLVYNFNAPNTCKHTIIPPPGHCNTISSGCSCHLKRSMRNCTCVRKCLVLEQSRVKDHQQLAMDYGCTSCVSALRCVTLTPKEEDITSIFASAEIIIYRCMAIKLSTGNRT